MAIGTVLLLMIAGLAAGVAMVAAAFPLVAAAQERRRLAAVRAARARAHAAAAAIAGVGQQATMAKAVCAARIEAGVPLCAAIDTAITALDRARVAVAYAAVGLLPTHRGAWKGQAVTSGTAPDAVCDGDGERRAWAQTALGVAVDALLLTGFWLVAAIGEWQFTAARLAGLLGDASGGADAPALSALSAAIFVAASATFAATLAFCAPATQVGGPALITVAHRRPLRRAAAAGLAGVAIASAALTIVSLEAASGVDDEVLLLVFWGAFVVFVVLGALVCGHVALRPAALLITAALLGLTSLPLRGGRLMLALAGAQARAAEVRAAARVEVARSEAEAATARAVAAVADLVVEGGSVVPSPVHPLAVFQALYRLLRARFTRAPLLPRSASASESHLQVTAAGPSDGITPAQPEATAAAEMPSEVHSAGGVAPVTGADTVTGTDHDLADLRPLDTASVNGHRH